MTSVTPAATDPHSTPGGPTPARKPRGRLDAGVAATVILLLGAVVGAVWAYLTPTLSGEVLDEGAALESGAAADEFSGVAILALMLIGYGLVAAGVAWFVAPRRRGPVGFLAALVVVAVGGLLATIVGYRVALWHNGDPLSMAVGETFELAPRIFRLQPDAWWEYIFATPWTLLICAPCALALATSSLALFAARGDLGVDDARATAHPATAEAGAA